MQFLTIFYAKNHGTLLYCRLSPALWQWASLSWGAFLNSVRPVGSTPFNAVPFWAIFSHITLDRSWVTGFCLHFAECTLPQQSPIANQVLYKHHSKLTDVSDRRVMIFLTTYFRTTPMADIKLTLLVTDTPIVYSTVRNFKKIKLKK